MPRKQKRKIKGLTYRSHRVINKIVFPKKKKRSSSHYHKTTNHSKQTITLVITQQYSHLHSVYLYYVYIRIQSTFITFFSVMGWIYFFFVVELSYLRLEVIFHCFFVFSLHFHLCLRYIYRRIDEANTSILYMVCFLKCSTFFGEWYIAHKLRRMREWILGWAVFVWEYIFGWI